MKVPCRWPSWPSGTGCRRSSWSRSWPPSSTAAWFARRSARTAATPWPRALADASLSHVIRLLDGALAPVGCASLHFYEPCSCPDEATCSLREAMIEVRDRMLSLLETETAGPDGPSAGHGPDRSARPPSRRRLCRADRSRDSDCRDGTAGLVPEQRSQGGLDPLLEIAADGRVGERRPRRVAGLGQRVAECLEGGDDLISPPTDRRRRTPPTRPRRPSPGARR